MSRIFLRKATMADADLLMAWRNERETLAASGNPRPVERDEHEAWLAGLLEDDHRHLLIAELSGTAVGQIRFERRRGAYEVSVSLAPEIRGRRMGPEVIRSGVGWLSKEAPDALVRALTKADNVRSIAAFKRAGFAPVESPTQGGWMTLERRADL